MTWQDVQALRKAGRFEEAVAQGLSEMGQAPHDVRLRGQVDWAWYGLIKQRARALAERASASQALPRDEIEAIVSEMRRYARVPRPRPDRSLSLILLELARIAAHLPAYAGIVRWVGIDGLAVEDWQVQKGQSGAFPPIGVKVARGLAKWIKEQTAPSADDLALGLDWLTRAATCAPGDDAVWVDWDRAQVLRLLGRHAEASEALIGVLRAKKQEFWAWAEAARLHASIDLELAIACACRALECCRDPRFAVKVHQELAQMLARNEAYAQASVEVTLAVETRRQHGWRNDAALQALLESPWYSATPAGAEDAAAFHARHAPHAFSLFHDVLVERAATYLGVFTPSVRKRGDGERRPRPLTRVAVRDDAGYSVTLVWPGLRGVAYEAGQPLTIVLGRDADSARENVVAVKVREDGASWDCTDASIGVIVREAAQGRRARVFVGRDDEELDVEEDALWDDGPVLVGEGVCVRHTRNARTGRGEVVAVTRGPLPERDVRSMRGVLRRNPKGFAFVGNAFVAPHLVSTLGEDVDEVEGVAVFGKHPARDEHAWRAVSLRAARSVGVAQDG